MSGFEHCFLRQEIFVKCLICLDVADVYNILGSLQPAFIKVVSPGLQHLDTLLLSLDSLEFCRVLVWVSMFCLQEGNQFSLVSASLISLFFYC